MEDPRLAQIRALCDDADNEHGGAYRGWLPADVVRRILGAPPVAVTPPQGIDRDALNRVLEEFSLLGLNEKSADRILALVRPVEGAHLDPERAAQVLDWCKREGGLDLYGWGDLITRLQDCIVPLPADAQSKVSEAYRKGYSDAQAHPAEDTPPEENFWDDRTTPQAKGRP